MFCTQESCQNLVKYDRLAECSPEKDDIRELKQRQRRRQRERHKFAYLVGKNNSFARPAPAFFTFVHFFAVVCKTTTWNSQIEVLWRTSALEDKFSFFL